MPEITDGAVETLLKEYAFALSRAKALRTSVDKCNDSASLANTVSGMHRMQGKVAGIELALHILGIATKGEINAAIIKYGGMHNDEHV